MKVIVVLLCCLLFHDRLSSGKEKAWNSGEPRRPSPHHLTTDLRRFPLDCQDIWDRGSRSDGVNLIYPHGSQHPLPVYCDMTTSGMPWTVFQKRFDGSVDFAQNWKNYLKGFGQADGEYWLGLQNIYLLTVRGAYELRVELEDFEGNQVSALYANFSLAPQAINADNHGYSLQADGFTDGGAGDSLSSHTGAMFSTFDNDHDNGVPNCAEYWGGGFWYHSQGCAGAGLNARYNATRPVQNVFSWETWGEYPESLRASQLKMRRSQKN
ncbi:microfibril-associated glycoprotein 4-like [Ascaphus truei]|uniref:microfibril-associated glycoprotein 4-like n=1 Tax=Ascaphus truei TaxID=8439 RepID=UPI003F596938